MTREANIALVPVGEDLNVRTVPRLKAQLEDIVSSGCHRIVLNMADVTYVDSCGMALIFTEVRRMRESGGLVSLINVNPRLMRAFVMCRLVDFAPIGRAGDRPEVAGLDPAVQPLWRTTVTVDDEDLSGSRAHVERLLRKMPFSQDDLFDLTLAVGEAMGNAVDHTQGGGVLATVSAYPDRAVVEVSDCGCGFALGRDERAVSEYATEERGRGIQLMRLLSDVVSIDLKPSGSGTVVHLEKLVNPADAL